MHANSPRQVTSHKIILSWLLLQKYSGFSLEQTTWDQIFCPYICDVFHCITFRAIYGNLIICNVQLESKNPVTNTLLILMIYACEHRNVPLSMHRVDRPLCWVENVAVINNLTTYSMHIYTYHM